MSHPQTPSTSRRPGRAWTRAGLALWTALAVAACSPQDQAALQTQVAAAAQTAVVQGGEAVATAAGALAQTAVAQVGTQAAQITLLPGAPSAVPEAGTLSPSGAAGPIATPTPPPSDVLDYFALGDSLASGHGLEPSTGTPCYRTQLAYPYQLRTLLLKRYRQVNLTHLACSGATVGEPSDKVLAEHPHKWLRNQVNDVLKNLSDRPTLVTLTIGANDLGWSNLSILPRMAETADVYLAWVESVRAEVAQELLGQVARLLLDHPNVTVAITEVPSVMNPQSLFFGPYPESCNDILGTLTCYERADYAIAGLNEAIVLDTYVPLSRPARLKIVPLAGRFQAHAAPRPACGQAAPEAADTWVQHPGGDYSYGPVPAWLSKITGHKTGDCFHPNLAGAQAIAGYIDDQLKK